MRSKRARAALGLIVGLFGVILGTTVALSQEEPVYYVEGARPEPTTGFISEDQLREVCVPYSEDRSETLICGDLPADFKLGESASPGEKFPGVCEAALKLYEADPATWSADSPEIDASSCWVIPTSTSASTDDPAAPEYHVIFDSKGSAAEPVRVSVDINGAAA